MDEARKADLPDPRSFLSALSEVVQSGISVLVWAGDADWICNWIGNYDVANAVEFDGQDEFKGKSLKPYTVNGTEKGTFKTVDNFSFLRVYEAGHEVPYYRKSFRSEYVRKLAFLTRLQNRRSLSRLSSRLCKRSPFLLLRASDYAGRFEVPSTGPHVHTERMALMVESRLMVIYTYFMLYLNIFFKKI